jgi:hypothetical protein
MYLIPLYDWAPYYGGWDMTGLLAACAAGAAPFAAVVVLRLGVWAALYILRFLIGFFTALDAR